MDADTRQATCAVEAKVVVDVDVEDELGLDVVAGIELVDGGIEHLAFLLCDEEVLAVGGEFEVGGRIGQHDELVLELALKVLVDVEYCGFRAACGLIVLQRSSGGSSTE